MLIRRAHPMRISGSALAYFALGGLNYLSIRYASRLSLRSSSRSRFRWTPSPIRPVARNRLSSSRSRRIVSSRNPSMVRLDESSIGHASIGTARIDLRDLVFILMEQVVVDVKLTLIAGRVFSLSQECDGGLQQQMSRFPFFAHTSVQLRKSQYADSAREVRDPGRPG